ncbi:hypothetical protein [Polaribacter sp.]|uniref:hypothetical protein n=1 Tax=Polaribacter sp. TaxID=1920175 RepID=UPI00404723CA
MKNFTLLIAATMLFSVVKTNAQEDLTQECTIKYNLFKGDFNSKKYDDAYANWTFLIDKCPDLSINIYKYGSTLAEDVKKDPALAKKVYEQRLQYFPNDNPAKLHSDYADYLAKNNLASDEEIFAILQKAYKLSPKDMSVKNIYKYFQGVTDKFKDTDPKRVFDTYDDVLESIDEKLDVYKSKINELTKDSTKVLDDRQKRLLNAYQINSGALGQIEDGLDNMITEIATCERLIPLYTRMFNKGCQEDPLFETLAKAYAEATPTPDSYTFYAGILEKNGDAAGANAMRKKAFDLETDPLKKAKYKLNAAEQLKSRGQLSAARALAREALNYNPNYGKAYLLIGRLYQSSVNECGSNEFEKRMVYAAALRQAQKAAAVDPSIGSSAARYIASYRANLPDKKTIFTYGAREGDSYTIKCWINETVTITTSGK